MIGAVAALGLMIVQPSAQAQSNAQSIIAVVNNDIISEFELQQRINLTLKSLKAPNTPEMRKQFRGQVLKSIIEERLQTQEAEEKDLAPTEEAMDRYIAGLEKQNNLKPGQWPLFIQSQGVDFAVFRDKVYAELAWNNLLRKYLSKRIRIGENEIDRRLEEVKEAIGKPEKLVYEIFVPVDSPREEPQAQATVAEIQKELAAGKSFPSVAQQYSRGATALQGGAVGWVLPGQLSWEVDQAVSQMQAGQTSQPIRAAGGYYIVKVEGVRILGQADPLKAKIDVVQIAFAPPPGTGPQEALKVYGEAQQASQSLRGCPAFEAAAKKSKVPGSGKVGTLVLGQIPDDLRDLLANLPVGQASQPVKRTNNYMVFMVCKREEEKVSIPNRQMIKQQLQNQRLELQARGYLTDLKNNAFIEIR